MALTNPVAGHTLEPEAIEPFGDEPQLDHEVAGQVRRLGFAALFLPAPDQGGLVSAHNDARVRATDEVAAVL